MIVCFHWHYQTVYSIFKSHDGIYNYCCNLTEIIFNKQCAQQTKITQSAIDFREKRRMLGISITDWKINKWIRQIGMMNVLTTAVHLKWRLVGLVMRWENNRWTKRLLDCQSRIINQKHQNGRPKSQMKGNGSGDSVNDDKILIGIKRRDLHIK